MLYASTTKSTAVEALLKYHEDVACGSPAKHLYFDKQTRRFERRAQLVTSDRLLPAGVIQWDTANWGEQPDSEDAQQDFIEQVVYGGGTDGFLPDLNIVYLGL